MNLLDVLPWVILFAPLVSTLGIVFFSIRRPSTASAVSVAGIVTAFAGSVLLFILYSTRGSTPSHELTFPWIWAGPVQVPFGFILDRLSVLMLLVVTGVSSCIFFYSIGYMKGDQSFSRYFASLSLFAFSMIGIVLANNLLMLFVFWELVAVSSYLLIGFWFEKPAAADAGNKAFIVNRLGDFGMVIGIFLLWSLSGAGGGERSFLFSDLAAFVPSALHQGWVAQGTLVAAALLIFCGVAGKSAQFPLYIWLPDAMEGPTPVSALIHAATMVAAGVYLLARMFFLIEGLPQALITIATLGAVTAFLSAVLAVVQNDIKKILAYSTISQLGYMVLAVGLAGPGTAMFHLTTHAFFKALLFLGAGAIIHSLHSQNIWEMGDLRRKMPVTSWTFLIGALALMGIPPLSGFFSKDEILVLAHESNALLYWVAVTVVALTAFYTTRLLWVALFGPAKKKSKKDIHEAPAVMRIPLLVLAFFALVGGFLGIPHLLGEKPAASNLSVMVTSTLTALLGIVLASVLYRKTASDPLERAGSGVYRFIVRKYYLDDFFSALAHFFQKFVSDALNRFDWKVIIARGVMGAAELTAILGMVLRRLQNGLVQTYALLFALGAAGMAFFLVRR